MLEIREVRKTSKATEKAKAGRQPGKYGILEVKWKQGFKETECSTLSNIPNRIDEA